jgi:hypothetical protein
MSEDWYRRKRKGGRFSKVTRRTMSKRMVAFERRGSDELGVKTPS